MPLAYVWYGTNTLLQTNGDCSHTPEANIFPMEAYSLSCSNLDCHMTETAALPKLPTYSRMIIITIFAGIQTSVLLEKWCCKQTILNEMKFAIECTTYADKGSILLNAELIRKSILSESMHACVPSSSLLKHVPSHFIG